MPNIEYYAKLKIHAGQMSRFKQAADAVVAAATTSVAELPVPMISTEPTCWFIMRSCNEEGSDPA